MIPSTIGSVLAFLGLVAPGLVFELLRERRRPAIEETALREASRIALNSLLFTLVGFGVAVAVRVTWSSVMPDPGRLLRGGRSYADDHYRELAIALVVIFSGSVCSAALCSTLFGWVGRRRGKISHGSVWYHLLSADRPRRARRHVDDTDTPTRRGRTQVWLQVRLTDGSTVSGYMRHFTTADRLEDREISLGGRFLRQGAAGQPESRIGTDWDVVVIRGDKIQYMRAVYVTADNKFVRRDGEPTDTTPDRSISEPARVPAPQGELKDSNTSPADSDRCTRLTAT